MSQPGEPLQFTPSPSLDAALANGWSAWIAAARSAGPEKTAAWFGRRLGERAEELGELAAGLLGPDREEAAAAAADLAEAVEEADVLLADTLWEGALQIGRDLGDPDIIFDATTQLAGIAEGHSDPLAAAEYYIDFLTWRRAEGHESDVDSVLTAFDEIIRLADVDGDRQAAAVWTYRQAQYGRVADADDDRATAGDWAPSEPPFTSWA